MKTILLLLLLASGCNNTYVARVDNGAGLGEGSRVLVSGVQVGQVTAVRVVEGHVDVEFEVESDHEITLRQDACALAMREEGGPFLMVQPGTGAVRDEDDESVIPQCRIEAEEVRGAFRELAEGMGELLEELGRGIFQGPDRNGNAPTFPIPNFPMPQPQDDESEACERVSVRIDGASIELRNDNTFAMQIAGSEDARLTDRDGRTLEPTRGWEPFELAAGATQRVTVELAGGASIDRVEIRESAPAGDPLSWCTIASR